MIIGANTAKQIAEYTTIAQNIILALSGIATVLIAYSGLTTWRRELKGKSEYTLAKDVLKSVYKVRQAFMVVRNPFMFNFEYPENMLDETGTLKSEFKHEGTTHAYQERWKAMAEAFNELETHTLDAQVEWGAEFQDVIVPLRKCRGELQMTIQNLLSAYKDPNENYMRSKRSAEEKAEERSVLYYIGEDSKHDKFTSEINAAIEKFEFKLRPHIKK